MDRNRVRAACAVATWLAVISVGCSTSDQPANTRPAPAEQATPQTTEVRCDRFQIVQSRTASILTVSLDTDLPDFTDVMVSISRSYFEKGSQDSYPLNYLEEKSTVGKWRQPREVSISHDRWNALWQDRQQKTTAAGITGKLDRVAPDVEIGFVVPVFQKNPIFGERNRNLSGAATTSSAVGRLVKAESRVRYPLNVKVTPISGR